MKGFLFAFKLMFLGAVFGAGFYTAWRLADGRISRLEAARIHDADQAALKIADAERRAAEATGRVVVRYVEKAAEVKWRTKEIIHEIPKYLPPEEPNSGCFVPRGFLVVRNAAAACGGALPDPSPATDGSPSGVTITDLARADAEWAGLYCRVSTQLESLQEWVTAQGTSGQP